MDQIVTSKITFNPGGNYSGMDLRSYELHTMNLEKCNFHNCNMEGMDLSGASFNYCNFRGANLWGVKLRDSNLHAIDIVACRGLIGGMTRTDGHIFYAVAGWPELMIKAGCRWFTVEQAYEHWDNEYNKESTAIVDCLVAMAKARGY